MPVWLLYSPVDICRCLQGWSSWYSCSNAHFAGIIFQEQLLWAESLLALPLIKHPLAIDDQWSAFLDLASFERNSTFHILLLSETKQWKKKVSGGDWEIHFKNAKCILKFSIRQLAALFDSSHGFARTVCWITLKSLGCISYFQQQLNQVVLTKGGLYIYCGSPISFQLISLITSEVSVPKNIRTSVLKAM